MADVIDFSSPIKTAATDRHPYQAASPLADKPLDKLTLIGASGWLETIWYADLRRISYHADASFGPLPVLRLWAPAIAEFILHGDRLIRLHDGLLEQRTAWLWEMPDDAVPSSEIIIRKITLGCAVSSPACRYAAAGEETAQSDALAQAARAVEPFQQTAKSSRHHPVALPGTAT